MNTETDQDGDRGRDSSLGARSAPLPEGAERHVVEALDSGEHKKALVLCAEQWGESLGRLCMVMLRSQSEAEDVAQDTLLTAYRSFASRREGGSVRAWLFGIARKKCLKLLENRRRHETKLVLLSGGEPDPTAEELLLRRRRAERAREALLEVRPTEREALVLRYQCELGYGDVAEACAIEESAARKRVSRGLARMREVLSEKGGAGLEAS